METKLCKVCDKIIKRGKMKEWHWDHKNTCGRSCATKYGHILRNNKPARTDERFCPYCDELLVRFEGEPTQAWNKRVHCSKSHAAFGKRMAPKLKDKPEISVEERLGVKRYQPGTPEFNAIAAQYM